MEEREFIERVAHTLDDDRSITSMICSVNPEIESEEVKEMCNDPRIDMFIPWIVFKN